MLYDCDGKLIGLLLAKEKKDDNKKAHGLYHPLLFKLH